MQRFLPAQFAGSNPARPSGWFLQTQDQDYAVLRLDVPQASAQPYFVLNHEFTHGIIHRNFSHLPLWLDEGIADFYGATEIQKDRVLMGKVPLSRLHHLRESTLLPAETFFTVDQSSPYYQEGDKTSTFYSQSWAAVHFLFMDPRARQEGLLTNFLKASNEVRDPLTAARQAFGDPKEFIGRLNSYAHQPTFRYWSYDLATRFDDKEFPTRKLSRAEGLVVRAEFLQRTQQATAALQLLVEALGLSPELGRAHSAMAYQHFLAKEYGKAQASFVEAERLGECDFRPPFYLGMIAMGAAGLNSRNQAEALLQLEKACARNPGFAFAHSLLGTAYLGSPETRSKALIESRKGVELEPWSSVNRAYLGQVCMALGLDASAKTIGVELQAFAQSSQEKALAKDYAGRLEEYLEGRRSLNTLPVQPQVPTSAPTDPDPEGRPTLEVRKSLKFRLPEKFKGLGQEVVGEALQGRLAEAIVKVEKALVSAGSNEDRKSLRALRDKLKAMQTPPM
jgi:Protein of unknown function (DUF1570)